MNKMTLNSEWKVRYEDLSWGTDMSLQVLRRKDGWLSSSLPCDVHMPLIEAGIIPEPLNGANSYSCQWIEEKSWWFKKEFCIDREFLCGDAVELLLESLDAEADIWLNGFYLGHHMSTFYPFAADVKKQLAEGENTLLIRMSTGVENVSDLDLAELRNSICTEIDGGRGDRGDKRRTFSRKPQYVFGWDWGPRVVTCGIMKDAVICSYNKLAVRSVYSVTKSAGSGAELEFELEIENLNPFSTKEANVIVEILMESMCELKEQKAVLLRSGLNHLTLSVELKNAKLWWPNGMGAQPLYDIKVSVCADGITAVYPVFKFGIRTLELDLDSINEAERLFAFKINGEMVFCKGGNWIPADSIYARVTDEKYNTLLKEAKEANFNMVRVWGGGIYERDIFYEKCDEYGILLWHDFMFACAAYPDKLDWFHQEAENEIEYQTRRLRNHASMALWCGSNECQWIALNEWGFKQDDPAYLGGSRIYDKLAPRIIRNNCPTIPYWNSSPYGGAHPNGDDVGDRHHWHECTMNPEMEKRITPEEYDQIKGKFISEYGYIGPCCKSSILKYHDGASIDRSGKIWQLHNNTFEKETVLAGIEKHYADPKKLDMDEYLLYAGLCQGLMLGYSLEAIRFKEDCWGSLFWMYNDCWGEVGWTIIDYYLSRKPSYYYVKRAFAPVKFILREVDNQVRVMGINETAKPVSADMEFGYAAFDGSYKHLEAYTLKLEPFSRKILLDLEKGNYDFNRGICCLMPVKEGSTILPAVLRSGDFRTLEIPRAELEITDLITEGTNIIFNVRSDVYAHAVHFAFEDNVLLSDEYFDLLPHEKRKVIIYNMAGKINLNDIKPKYIIRS